MRRAITALGLALYLAGCGSTGPTGDPVQLLTYDGAGLGCLTNANPVLLVADPQAGTAADHVGGTPVVWPAGYIGRRVGPEVAVYDGSGRLVATTGKYWYMAQDPEMYTRDDGRFYQCGEVPLNRWDPSATPPPG